MRICRLRHGGVQSAPLWPPAPHRTQMPDEKLIEIHNATVYRGNTRVFHNLSLCIDRHQNTAIIGPNGAGKSTFLKLVTRELYPLRQQGSRIRILGKDKWDIWSLRAGIGIVSPDLQHNYAGNVRGVDVVLSGYYSSIGTYEHQAFTDEQHHRAGTIMEDLGITGIQEHQFARMSTGEQRRFLLGRALVNTPHTLILDEPTTGLDLTATYHYLETVRGLMQCGITIVLVTHHIHEIPPEITTVVFLKHGEVRGQGSKQTMLTARALTELFETPIDLVNENGFYQTFPGNTH